MATQRKATREDTIIEAHETNGHDANQRGRGWHGDPERHAAAGRKGGQTVAQNREHMASIGRKGGQSVSQNREYMAEIGRRGGRARGEKSTEEEKEAQEA